MPPVRAWPIASSSRSKDCSSSAGSADSRVASPGQPVQQLVDERPPAQFLLERQQLGLRAVRDRRDAARRPSPPCPAGADSPGRARTARPTTTRRARRGRRRAPGPRGGALRRGRRPRRGWRGRRLVGRVGEELRQRAVLGGAVDALDAAFSEPADAAQDPVDRRVQVGVERAQRRVAGAEPARELRPLAPQQRELALAHLALGQPRVRCDRDQRLEHQRLALRVGAQLRDLRADRVGVLAELAPEPAQVVRDLALVVGERRLVDRLRGGHRRRQLAHELRGPGAQPLELRLQLGEGALQAPRVQLSALHGVRQLTEQRPDPGEPVGVQVPDRVDHARQVVEELLDALAERGDVVGEVVVAQLGRGAHALEALHRVHDLELLERAQRVGDLVRAAPRRAPRSRPAPSAAWPRARGCRSARA